MSQPDVVTMGDPLSVVVQECPFCEGEGRLPFRYGGVANVGKICPKCHGSGVRPETVGLVAYPGLVLDECQ